MVRAILAESQMHPAIREVVQSHGQQIVGEVQAAVAAHPVVVRLESPGAHAQTGGVKTCLDSAGTAKLADSRNVFRVSKSRERDRWKQGGSGVEGRKKLLKNARALGRPGRLGNPARGLKRVNPWSAGILARTGESPVSGPICQPNRTDWNTPTTTRQSREVLK